VQTQKPREIAFRVLRTRTVVCGFVEPRLEAELARAGLGAADRSLSQELVYGVVRWQATLDWLIARKTAGGRPQKTALQILLRLGLYQMFWLDRIPDHAAVHETVQLARELGLGAQAGFVNAVLRGYARERTNTRQQLEELKVREPATGWSHPAWLVARWTTRWGAEQTSRLLAWNNTPARAFARLNTLHTDAPRLLAGWRAESVVATAGCWAWVPENTVFELESHPPLASLATFQQGWFYVQDPSTLLAVHLLDPQPGESVLDLCAAPGGKTSYLAQRMGNTGCLMACDLAAARLPRLRDNCARLGINCTIQETPPPELRFDRVLVDAPCSNTGVLRRRVDLRWRLQPEGLPRLNATQLGLLDRAKQALRPGGTLVYSTCSLEPEENRAVVDAWLVREPGMRLVCERELLPFHDGVDGAYVALFRCADSP
jgi:16S rRNA (cytosine967-C5)-methyltransferase